MTFRKFYAVLLNIFEYIKSWPLLFIHFIIYHTLPIQCILVFITLFYTDKAPNWNTIPSFTSFQLINLLKFSALESIVTLVIVDSRAPN